MAPRTGKRLPFDQPGRSTAWGAIGTLAAAMVDANFIAALVIATVSALIGCYDP